MTRSSYITFLCILTLALVGSSCSSDKSSESGSGGEQAAAAKAESKPSRKPSEVLVGSWETNLETVTNMQADPKLKAIQEEMKGADKADAFKMVMEVMVLTSAQWTFTSDGTLSTKVAEYAVQPGDRDEAGNFTRKAEKNYKQIRNSGKWTTASETDSEITITTDFGAQKGEYTFRVADDDTIHALIFGGRYPLPLYRFK